MFRTLSSMIACVVTLASAGIAQASYSYYCNSSRYGTFYKTPPILSGTAGDDVVYVEVSGDLVKITASFLSPPTQTVDLNEWGIELCDGDDLIVIGDGVTSRVIRVNGGNGNDRMVCGEGWEKCLLFGYAGNDVLVGNSASDELYGGDGDDRIHGTEGVDSIDGGDGDDACEDEGTAQNCESVLKKVPRVKLPKGFPKDAKGPSSVNSR